jgi:hypothetical protein
LKRQTKNLLAILLIFGVILFLLFSPFGPKLSTGIITGFQGLEMSFNSIFWKNYWYDASNKGPNPNYNNKVCSANSFFDHVNFDPDEETDLLPNLHASMQPVTVDTSVAPVVYGPWRIKVGTDQQQITNSSGTFTINYDVYKEFQMNRYKCDWRVDFWLDGAYNEYYPSTSRHYYDLQLWVKVLPRSFVYFQDNPDQVYFAPAYIGLDEKAFWGYYDPGSKKFEEDSAMGGFQDIFPEAEGEVMGIFYNKGGVEDISESKLLKYQGFALDPEIFREEYWIRFSFNTFKPVSWFGTLCDWYTHFPSVTLKFRVYVFVVGEWTVKLKTGEVKELQSHQTEYAPTGWEWIGWLGNWFSNPVNQLWLFFIIIVIVIVVVSIASPGLWTVLASRKR